MRALLPLALALMACSGSSTSTRIAMTTEAGDPFAEVELSDGQHLAVRLMGAESGTPLLLLTGGPGFAGDQLLPLAERLDDSHRVVLPDQRGTGRSTQEPFDPSAYTIDRAVADLEELRRLLGVDGFVLVGHSWGGILSMAYAAEHPERAEALALVCPGGIDASFWADYNANLFGRLSPDQQEALGALRPADDSPEAAADVAREMNALLAPVTVLEQAAVPALQAELRDRERFAPAVGQAFGPSLFRFDLRPRLAEFDRPVLVLQGEGDPIGRPGVERIVDTLPDAELQILPGVGHWPFHEDLDGLVAALAPFLDEVTTRDG